MYSQIQSNISNYMPTNVIKSGEVIVSSRSLEHMNCILPANNLKGGLYLGDVVSLLKQDLL
jgi:bifunctional N-acetylglucosamine-1-phosphate-uridyltransferase/glucosamine-1-phosphate-acetyltransferase GlmU-like protein